MPDFPLVPFFQLPTPSLGQIGNQNAALTPPFFPQDTVPQGNPYDVLLQVLNNLQNQPLQQAPQPSKFQSILNAIAGGVSVAASKNPGEALAQQLQSREQQRQLQTQQLQQRQNLLDQVRLQVGINQANQLSQEQARAREQQRAYVIKQKEDESKIPDLKAELGVREEFANKAREDVQKFNEKYHDKIRQWQQEGIVDTNIPKQQENFQLTRNLIAGLDDKNTPYDIREEVARRLTGLDQTQPSEKIKPYLDDFEKKIAVFNQKATNAKISLEEAQAEEHRAVAKATASGQRYLANQQFNPDNILNKGLITNLSDELSKNLNKRFYRDNSNPNVIIDDNQLRSLGIMGMNKYTPLTDQENDAYIMQRMRDSKNKIDQLMQKGQGSGDINQINPSGANTFDITNDKVGQYLVASINKDPSDTNRQALAKQVLTMTTVPQDKKALYLQILQIPQPTGANTTTPTQPQTREDKQLEQYKAAELQKQKNIIAGLEKEIANTKARIEGPTPLGGSKDALRAKLQDLENRLNYAKSQLGNIPPPPTATSASQGGFIKPRM